MEIFSKNIYIYTLIQEEREIMAFPLLIKKIDSRVINLIHRIKHQGQMILNMISTKCQRNQTFPFFTNSFRE